VKNFDDLSTEEMAALTPEQVSHYIDVECLEQGIPLADIEEDKPVVEYPAKTEVFFRVGGMVFKHEADAMTVASFETMNDRYESDIGYGSEVRWYEPHDDGDYGRPKIEAVKAPTRAAVLAGGAKLRAQLAALEAWKKREKTSDDNAKKRSAVASEVWSVVNKASATLSMWERLATTFVKYLDVAGGDREIALRFMRTAHPQFEGEAEKQALARANKLSVDNKAVA